MNAQRSTSDNSASHTAAAKARKAKEFRKERREVRALRNDHCALLARY